MTEFVRLSDSQPDGPYRALSFGLYMQDQDGERTLIANPDFNDVQVGTCSGAGCNARLIDEVPMEAYFGRVQAGTRQGWPRRRWRCPCNCNITRRGSGTICWRINVPVSP